MRVKIFPETKQNINQIYPWRSLVVHPHLKAVYLVGSQSVNIAALWDTRRNPSTMANYLDRLVQTQPTVVCEPHVPYQPASKKG